MNQEAKPKEFRACKEKSKEKFKQKSSKHKSIMKKILDCETKQVMENQLDLEKLEMRIY